MPKIVVETINHLNYPDKQGQVYCRADHAIKEIEPMKCSNCPLYFGSIQGQGVECFYPDAVSDVGKPMYIPVPNPQQHLSWITDLIAKMILPADPYVNEG